MWVKVQKEGQMNGDQRCEGLYRAVFVNEKTHVPSGRKRKRESGSSCSFEYARAATTNFRCQTKTAE